MDTNHYDGVWCVYDQDDDLILMTGNINFMFDVARDLKNSHVVVCPIEFVHEIRTSWITRPVKKAIPYQPSIFDPH